MQACINKNTAPKTPTKTDRQPDRQTDTHTRHEHSQTNNTEACTIYLFFVVCQNETFFPYQSNFQRYIPQHRTQFILSVQNNKHTCADINLTSAWFPATQLVSQWFCLLFLQKGQLSMSLITVIWRRMGSWDITPHILKPHALGALALGKEKLVPWGEQDQIFQHIMVCTW